MESFFFGAVTYIRSKPCIGHYNSKTSQNLAMVTVSFCTATEYVFVNFLHFVLYFKRIA